MGSNPTLAANIKDIMRIKPLTYLTFSAINPEFKIIDTIAGNIDVICETSSLKLNLTETSKDQKLSFYMSFAKINTKTKYNLDFIFTDRQFSLTSFGGYKYVVTSPFFKTKKFNRMVDVKKFLKSQFNSLVKKILKIKKWEDVEKKVNAPFGTIDNQSYNSTSWDGSDRMISSHIVSVNPIFDSYDHSSFHNTKEEASTKLQSLFDEFKKNLLK